MSENKATDEKIERILAEFNLTAFSKAEYFCWKADRDFQVADEAWEYLKEHGKDLLAAIMTESKGTEKISESALDRLARSSKKWRTHRAGEHAARKKRNELRFKSRAAQRYFDCIQSGLAFKRSDLKRLGAQET